MTIEDGYVVGAKSGDGRIHVHSTPGPLGLTSWFTGAADHATNGRGQGTKIYKSFQTTDSGLITVADLAFNEPVHLHDGAIWYDTATWPGQTASKGATMEDVMHLRAMVPANSPVVNGTNEGNCNLTDIGGGVNLITPADGDGTHDVTLADCAPIPSQDLYGNGTGYWDVDQQDGTITAGTAGSAGYNMIDAAKDLYFLINIPLGHPLGMFEIDVYDTELIHQNWTLRVEVDKSSSNAFDLAGWLMTFRDTVTIT